jgi:hypothetical protein
MADTPVRPATSINPPNALAEPLWSGTGLCCEAQGDGVPCHGPAGECEACGRALPAPQAEGESWRPGEAPTR